MKQTCDYCGGYLEDTDQTCPHCGATNANYNRASSETPRTIEELKEWYTAHNLPPKEVTRFFIGEDCREARAFGIYEKEGHFIVYKNKEDGSRAVRYDGADEAYAVNELYMKLKERIAEQKALNQMKQRGAAPRRRKRRAAGAGALIFLLIVAIVILGTALLASFLAHASGNGYYHYDGRQYYKLDSSWYMYNDDTDEWESTRVDDELKENKDKYYESSGYNSSYGTSNFRDTEYYSDWEESHKKYNDSSSSNSDSSSSWDSDSSWDSSSSWDSGAGDWSSDW